MKKQLSLFLFSFLAIIFISSSVNALGCCDYSIPPAPFRICSTFITDCASHGGVWDPMGECEPTSFGMECIS
ncbi:MAG: hypothetical protein ABIJ20_00690 [Nanoarchaeota archaeon]|nr:hypothetical protein [Nanoarchaeota archaeon]MBU1445167.1 hypothetical protein [Nanoarchaeota archaeon]MBU2420882.1 hypothetical protein [Nanoarchaeota archaeon]MBU2475353.1 hypothetical protein [Nanoarchaeota archaeon]